jgi:hypothetical protein
MDWNLKVIPGIVEQDLMKFPSVSIDRRRLPIKRQRSLCVDMLPRVFVNAESMVLEVDTDGQHAVDYRSPARKDAAPITSK